MNTTTPATPERPALTAFQQGILDALRELSTDYQPQETGGFDPDDISAFLHLRRIPYTCSCQIQTALFELWELRLVSQVEPPNSSPWNTHWKL